MSILSLKQLCVNTVIKFPEIYGQRAQDIFSYELQALINKICFELGEAFLFPPSIEELKQKLLLIHATDVLPKEKTLKAGARLSHKVTHQTVLFLTSRKTVHCTLSHLVQPHTLYTWEHQKFAFLFPIEDHSLIHIFPEDTFSLGDLKLSKEALCLTHEQNREELLQAGFLKEQVITFDDQTSLRDAINGTIEAQKRWILKTKPNQPTTGLYARFSTGPYRFFDLGSSYFYSSLFKNSPFPLSFGPLTNSAEGFGGLTKTFELSLFIIANQFYRFSSSTENLKIPEKEEIEFYLNAIPEILSWEEFTFFVSSHLDGSSYNEWLSWVYYTLQLMSLDLALRESHGCSFAVDYLQETPQDLFDWRKDLFLKTEQTPLKEKPCLLEKEALLKRQNELTKIIEKKPSIFITFPKNRPVDAHLHYHEQAALEFITVLPRKYLDRFLTKMLYVQRKNEKGNKESLMLSTKIYYLIGKYFITYDESYLKEIASTLKAMQKELSLQSEIEVFEFMALNHYPVYSLLCTLFVQIDQESNIYPIAEKFANYFGIKIKPSKINEGLKKPNLEIEFLNSIKEEFTKSKPSDHLWGACLLFESVRGEFKRICSLFNISQEEVLMHWKYYTQVNSKVGRGSSNRSKFIPHSASQGLA